MEAWEKKFNRMFINSKDDVYIEPGKIFRNKEYWVVEKLKNFIRELLKEAK